MIQGLAAAEILRNNVKEKSTRGEVVSSMTVRLARSPEIARIAKIAAHARQINDIKP